MPTGVIDEEHLAQSSTFHSTLFVLDWLSGRRIGPDQVAACHLRSRNSELVVASVLERYEYFTQDDFSESFRGFASQKQLDALWCLTGGLKSLKY